jgi:hypothetical protein
MEQSRQMLETIILGEIEGKNRAIHAYDGIIWKIRAGFLALLFGGWATLLKGIVEASQAEPSQYRLLAIGLMVFSIGFALGAWIVDRNYVQRKFRVILALDALTDEIRNHADDCTKIPINLLKVAGDNGAMPFASEGYRQAMIVSTVVYLAPLLTVVVGVFLVLR